MEDIIRFTCSEDGVFAHVTKPDGHQIGVCLDLLGEEGTLLHKWGVTVADQVRARMAGLPADPATHAPRDEDSEGGSV